MTVMFSDGKGTLSGDGQVAVRDGLAVLTEAVRANNIKEDSK